MNINRNNYEVFFLLYIDRELSREEMQEVEKFLLDNPDLQLEMDMLTTTILQEETASTVFPDKTTLYRTEDTESPVTILNYETFFVQYGDDELSNEEKAATEKFVYEHPEFQAEFELIQQARLTPETSLVYPGKEKLFRGEAAKIRPIFPVWTRYAAAAMVLLTLGLFWINRQSNDTTGTDQQVAAATPATVDSIQPPVKSDQRELASLAPVKTSEGSEKTVPAPSTKNVLAGTEPEKQVVAQRQASNSQTASLEARIPDEALAVKLPGSSSIADKLEDPTVGSLAISSLNTNEKAVKPATHSDEQIIVVAINDDSRDDNVFVPGKELIRKTPLRGLLRKAGRIAGKTNPFSEDRAKSGVFTASSEQ